MSASGISLEVALPIAHRTAAQGSLAQYTDYYDLNNLCTLTIDRYFKQERCEGFRLVQNSLAILVPPVAPDYWALYALTHGSLSYQNHSLVLRLRREKNTAIPAFASGQLFAKLHPQGVQLRYVIYELAAADDESVRQRINTLVDDPNHPMRAHQQIRVTNQPVQTLGNYLKGGDPATRKQAILDQFMSGQLELLVRAGDLIGDFGVSTSVTLKMLDSCGALTPGSSTQTPLQPIGRPCNPSYFLYLLLSTTNQAAIRLLTSMDLTSNPQLPMTHPLLHLFSTPPAVLNVYAQDAIFDLRQANRPRPLQLTLARPAGGQKLPVGALGKFHESRNASNPTTAATMQWRLYGDDAADTDDAQVAQLVVMPKLTPPQAPDVTAKPNLIAQFQLYWQRYATIINAVATAFEVPCEFLLAFAMKETNAWFNDETNVSKIRLEPLKPQSFGAADPIVQAYKTAAGAKGIARTLPIPWNGGAPVRTPASTLTWDQLATLNDQYLTNVLSSPGVIQTLVRDAHTHLDWVESVYGATYIPQIHCDVEIPDPANPAQTKTVTLHADAPPPGRVALLAQWFAVAVDADGNTVTANPHAALTRKKRALHGFIGGAAHIKFRYNNGSTFIVTDFDPPTVASAYNDGGGLVKHGDPAIMRYGMSMRPEYAQGFPIIYNSAVSFLNSNPTPVPSFRLGRSA